jgi:hypothetical protein
MKYGSILPILSSSLIDFRQGQIMNEQWRYRVVVKPEFRAEIDSYAWGPRFFITRRAFRTWMIAWGLKLSQVDVEVNFKNK